MKEAKYKIIISEPWDFEGPAGLNLIVGIIVRVLSSTCVIFKSDHLLRIGENEGQVFLLKARYEGQNLEDLKGTVGGALILTNNYEEQDEKKLEENSEYVIIGALEKV
jgi:hypothetical protein